ncbi:MAG: hypothetical protein NZM08_06935 [Chitinophagales bacterium]|nr:hypothetical protein [Chitinophagales bacterium]
MKNLLIRLTGTWFLILLTTANLTAQEASQPSAADLANQLSNPVASLISVPFQSNMDFGIGSFNGSRTTVNIQPVIPISLKDNWNLITRVILPVISQYDIMGEGTSQFGLSDAVVSGFLSPVNPVKGMILGFGPAFLVPTATDEFLGTEKFGVGPTGLVLRQAKGWTSGMLVNHIWSVAGDTLRSDVSSTFLQPFVAYNFPSGAGITAAAEVTQNWVAENTSGVLALMASGITMMGKQVISLAVGPRIHFSGPDFSRPDYGVRGVLTLVFPK